MPAPVLRAGEAPVCYVLEDYGLSNALILERACREAGLPRRCSPSPAIHWAASAPTWRCRGGMPARRAVRRTQDPIPAPGAPAEAHRADPNWTCSWCRCRSSSAARRPQQRLVLGAVFRALGAGRPLPPPAGDPAQRPRHRGAVLADVSRCATSWPRTCRTSAPCARPSRVLRAHFRRIRAAVIGPDLSTRRLLVDAVLTPSRCARRSPTRPGATAANTSEAWKKAHALRLGNRRRLFAPGGALAVVRLTGFWNRIYDGVTVHHLDKLKQIAPGP